MSITIAFCLTKVFSQEKSSDLQIDRIFDNVEKKVTKQIQIQMKELRELLLKLKEEKAAFQEKVADLIKYQQVKLTVL